MERGSDGLSHEQQEALALFREVTAGSRAEESAVHVLKSCNWNVEQALQLHWASADEDHALTGPSASSSTAASTATPGGLGGGPLGELGVPLLTGGQGRPPSGRGSPTATPPAATRVGALAGWLSRGLRRIGATVFSVLRTFIFGPGGPRLGGPSSGMAFQRALTAAYGAQLQLPHFFEGTFPQALQAAQRELKLLVLFLHSEYARDSQSFCSTVLANELVRTMLDENFVLWGGDVARMESYAVAQMIHARQYPCFCVLLPASVDEVRVIGCLQGEVHVDAAIGLLAHCFEEMESHRAEIVARSAQHAEDRTLREQQDREYQEALEMDRKRAEQQQAQEQEAREARRLAEEAERRERELLERAEAERLALERERRAQAAALEPEGPDATARVALRLPAGQRTQRKFRPNAKLADVYMWAGCLGFLPENEGKGLEIPRRFMLKMSFPSRDLTEMDRTIEELQLAGTNLLLAAVDEEEGEGGD